MNTDDTNFVTAVRGVAGAWPPSPGTWSYSSLSDAEECPRRWALSRATYPDIWKHSGYPPRPILPALVGDVIHRVLEVVLRGLRRHGCESLSDRRAVVLLKELGGYSELIEQAIKERLGRMVDNPRMVDQLEGIGTALRIKLPDMRQRVQAVLARTTVSVLPISEAMDSATALPRAQIHEGSHPEVELRAPELRFAGRVDLLTVSATSCTIIDYKSGIPHARHAEQLVIYALLWSRDLVVNPNRLPVAQLVRVYSTHDVVQQPPTDAELEALAVRLQDRLLAAESDLQMRPPPARPSPTICGFCSVRQMCEDYWAGVGVGEAATAPTGGADFIDAELDVLKQNGPKSWEVETSRNATPTLLRTITETPGFKVGDKVRLIDAVQTRDDDSGRTVITMTRASEVYVLDRSR